MTSRPETKNAVFPCILAASNSDTLAALLSNVLLLKSSRNLTLAGRIDFCSFNDFFSLFPTLNPLLEIISYLNSIFLGRSTV